MRTTLLLVFALLVGACKAPEPAVEPPFWTAFGLQVRDVPASARDALGIAHGVMVTQVRAPADRTRILPGDVIVAVDRQEVQTAEEFGRIAAERSARSRAGVVGLLVRRTDADLFIAVEPAGAAPAATRARPGARGTPLRI